MSLQTSFGHSSFSTFPNTMPIAPGTPGEQGNVPLLPQSTFRDLLEVRLPTLDANDTVFSPGLVSLGQIRQLLVVWIQPRSKRRIERTTFSLRDTTKPALCS